MSIQLVVARYNEDITWTKLFKNVIIYNKGLPLEGYTNQIFLPNLGREGHTYYKHIYDNYDRLADYTIFLQGFPFDHSPNILNLLQYIYNNIHNYTYDFRFLSSKILPCNLERCEYHNGLPLKEVFYHLFTPDIKELNYIFGAGAQFIVSKKAIHKRPKEFYLKLVKLLEKSVNPIEGFVIERFHYLIFSDIKSC
jgi:hypothetical protein